MRKEPREFFVLLSCRQQLVDKINWASHGKSGVWPHKEKLSPGSKIIKVREVLPRKKRNAK